MLGEGLRHPALGGHHVLEEDLARLPRVREDGEGRHIVESRKGLEF